MRALNYFDNYTWQLDKFYILENFFNVSDDIIIYSKRDYLDEKELLTLQNPDKNLSIQSRKNIFYLIQLKN